MNKMLTTLSCRLFPDQQQSQRLQQLLTRDTRIISRIISVLSQEEKTLFSKTKSGKWRVSRSDLANLMLTTATRPQVKYNLKAEFQRISHNELMECIDTAVENYLAYLVNQHQYNASPPTADYQRGYVPRSIGYRRFKLHQQSAVILSIIDSYHSNYRMVQQGLSRVRHDYLDIPIELNDYQQQILAETDVKLKAVKIICQQKLSRDHPEKFRAQLAVELDIEDRVYDQDQELAIVGMDLGIKKLITAVIVTASGLIQTRTFHPQELQQIEKLDQQIEQLIAEHDRRQWDHYRHLLHHYADHVTFDVALQLRQLSSQLRAVQQYGPRSDAGKLVKQQVKQVYEITLQKNSTRWLNRVKRMLSELLDHWNNLDRTQGLINRLKQLRQYRSHLVENSIKQLCADISKWIGSLDETYNVEVAMGDVSHIRQAHYRGNGNKWLRKQVHQWQYKRIYEQLSHNLGKLGLSSRWHLVAEYWTSMYCHRCNKRGSRPRQHRFICNNYHCLW